MVLQSDVKPALDYPLQLEADVNRGVLYLHSLFTSQTILRVCRIPDDLMQLFHSGMVAVVIDLKRTPMRKEGVSVRRHTIKTDPVYLELPDYIKDIGEFSVVDSSGRTHFRIMSVPVSVMKRLWLGEFADITLGYTGR